MKSQGGGRLERFLSGLLSHRLSGRTPGMLGKIPYLLCLRGCVLCVVGVRFAFPWSRKAGSMSQIAAMFAAMLIMLVVLVALHWRREKIRAKAYRRAMVISVLADVALFTWAYILTGRVTSDFFMFYYLPILTAAEYLDLSEIGVAILLALGGLGVGLSFLSIQVRASTIGDPKGIDLIAMWVTRGGFLVLFALVSIVRTRLQRN